MEIKLSVLFFVQIYFIVASRIALHFEPQDHTKPFIIATLCVLACVKGREIINTFRRHIYNTNTVKLLH